MTELNDHLKLLFARAAALYCQCCGKPVRRDTPESIYADLSARAAAAGDPRLLSDFPGAGADELHRSGSARAAGEAGLHALLRADRAPPRVAPAPARGVAGKRGASAAARAVDARSRAGPLPRRQRRARPRARVARGRAARRPRARRTCTWSTTADPPQRLDSLALLQRAALRRLRPPLPRADPEPVLVQLARRRLRDLPRLRPRHRHRLRPRHPGREQDAARRRDQALADASPTRSARTTSIKFAQEARHPARHARGASSAPSAAQVGDRGRRRVEQGASGTARKRFFDWLETKAYKMHVRVLLSRYRAYTPCDDLRRRAPEARGAAVARSASRELADSVLGADAALSRPHGVQWSDETLRALPGLIDPRPDAAAGRARSAVLPRSCSCRSRWTKPPTCCSARSAPASAISPTWAWAI